MSHSSKILFTCIWKVPLDFFDSDLMEQEGRYEPAPTKKPPEWSPEQIEIIQSMGDDGGWKFNYDSVIEYCLTQNNLHERC